MMDAIRKMLGPLHQRISMVAGRAIVRLIDDSGAMQVIQVGALADETLDQVEHAQPYGHASYPKKGAEAILLSLGGIRGRAIVIQVADRRYRLQGLAEGEVALYDDQGQYVWIKRAGLAVSALKVDVVTTGTATVTAAHCNLVSNDVNLGAAGGQPVARVGDAVVGGVITSGSAKVRAA